MAAAIVCGLNRDHWRVIVCEVVASRRKELEETMHVETVSSVTDPKILVRLFCTIPRNNTREKTASGGSYDQCYNFFICDRRRMLSCLQ